MFRSNNKKLFDRMAFYAKAILAFTITSLLIFGIARSCSQDDLSIRLPEMKDDLLTIKEKLGASTVGQIAIISKRQASSVTLVFKVQDEQEFLRKVASSAQELGYDKPVNPIGRGLNGEVYRCKSKANYLYLNAVTTERGTVTVSIGAAYAPLFGSAACQPPQ